ncbi:MAG TPA: aminomethyl-transferring glycine dehydrogenase subunit GcvPA [Gammaproteobacteria bacterium]|nr:aminomethyl-transferring glycine dehydrogenase subunit GcvPA [Gammaproteobacteria bacterium]
MPFIPHTEEDTRAMLDAIGAESIDDLFDEIPAKLRAQSLDRIPMGRNEMAVSRLLHERAADDSQPLSFLGAGAYEHHIPAAVWELTTRGEFYTAYTPYQAEASQGTLQLLYEFQTMMAELTAMDISNASLYDGASALAEAVLMAVRANRKSKSRRILMPATVHPTYRKVVDTIVRHQGIQLEIVDFDMHGGHVDPDNLPAEPGDITAMIIPQPNFFGALEDVHALTDWAQSNSALVIGVVNPTAMALITPPGEWGNGNGADIVCGEGQPLGVPLSSGGPYFGFMCCAKKHVRQMPGRIIGRTTDLEGKTGYVLTLQAREQHIRRSKATSNICTNQGLLTTAATIYLSLVGPEGLRQTAAHSHSNTQQLMEKLCAIDGVEKCFDRPSFHEAALRLAKPVDEVLSALDAEGILGGYDLSTDYPQLGNAMLVCATETKTEADLEHYAAALQKVLA